MSASGEPIVSAPLTVGTRDLTGAEWRYVLRRARHGFVRHRGIDSAAALSFFAALSLVPGALAIVSTVAILSSRTEAADTIVRLVGQLAPESIAESLREPITALSTIPNPGWALAVGIIVAVWSLSAFATACGRAINSVYEVQEGRGAIHFRALMLVVSVVLTIAAVPAIVILAVTPVVADNLANAAGIGEPWVSVWNVGKWPVLALDVAFIVAVLYYFTPNVRHTRMRWVSVGALLAMFAWGAATAGFLFYVSNIALYDLYYGWLGGVIVVLLWLFISNLVLIGGAELDAELVRMRQLRAGLAAEEVVQLPMRDTKRNFILARQRAADVAEGREIRTDANPGPVYD